MADPDRFEGAERRKHERFEVAVPVTFVCELTHTTYRGTIRNIGEGGLLLETSARLSRLERVSLYLPAGEAGRAVIGAVVVRYHLESAVGVAFVALSREDQQRVNELIARYRSLHAPK